MRYGRKTPNLEARMHVDSSKNKLRSDTKFAFLCFLRFATGFVVAPLIREIESDRRALIQGSSQDNIQNLPLKSIISSNY